MNVQGCNELFNSASAFDFHRTGKFGTGKRRCLTVPEMKAKGMAKNAAEFWTRKPRPSESISSHPCTPLGRDHGSGGLEEPPGGRGP